MRRLLLCVAFAVCGCEERKRGEYSATEPTVKSSKGVTPSPSLDPPVYRPAVKTAEKTEPAPALEPVKKVVKQEGTTEKAARLRREIESLKAQLKEKETELLKLEPAAQVKTVEVGDNLDVKNLTIGEAGRFWGPGFGSPSTVKVAEIIDENKAILVIYGESNRVIGWGWVLVRNFPTKGIADGKDLGGDAQFKVVGTETYQGKTEKYQGKTFYVVEPYTPKKK